MSSLGQSGATPLQFAAASGREHVVSLLILAGANLDANDQVRQNS